MKKWIIISAIIVVIAGAGGWLLLGNKNQAQSAADVAQTTTVQKGKLEVTVSGSVTAITDQDVTADNTIIVVDSVNVASGNTVYKGQTLVTFKNGVVVKASYKGEITAVNVKGGSSAARGTVLLRIEDGEWPHVGT